MIWVSIQYMLLAQGFLHTISDDDFHIFPWPIYKGTDYEIGTEIISLWVSQTYPTLGRWTKQTVQKIDCWLSNQSCMHDAHGRTDHMSIVLLYMHACMHACIPVYHLWICVWIVLKNLHISCNMHTSDKNYRKCTCHTHLTLQFKCCDYMPCACNIIIIIICPLHFTWYWKHPSITQLIYVFVGTSGCSCIYFYIN
jgi:hypothetical protein